MDQEIQKNSVSSEKEPAGAMVSIVVVALVIIAGAYYFSRLLTAPETTQATQTQR